MTQHFILPYIPWDEALFRAKTIQYSTKWIFLLAELTGT